MKRLSSKAALFACVSSITAVAMMTLGCATDDACNSNEYKNGSSCSACGNGKHINKDRNGCDTNTDTDCGPKHTDCTSIQNSKDGSCDVAEGKCIIECQENFQLMDDACVDRRLQVCTKNADCAIPENAESAHCEKEDKAKSGFCEITCVQGFHKTSPTSCAENIYAECEKDDECSELEGAEKAVCQKGSCVIQSCKLGYHADKNALCKQDTEKSCGSDSNDCTTIENISMSKCEDGKCIVETCRAGFHPSDELNFCDEDTDLVCGNQKNNCRSIENATNQKCVQGLCQYECVPGARKDGDACTIDSCLEGFHHNEAKDKCNPDTDNECGEDLNNCELIPKTETSTCVRGICEFKCKDGTTNIKKVIDETFDEGCYTCSVGTTNYSDIKKRQTDNDPIECIDGDLSIDFKGDTSNIVVNELIFMTGGMLSSFGDRKIQRMELKKLPLLKSISLSGGNCKIDTISFEKLAEIKEGFKFLCGGSYSFDILESVGQSFEIKAYNTGYLNFGNLKQIGGSFILTGHLNSMNFSSLENIGGEFKIDSSSTKTDSLSFDNLKHVKGKFTFSSFIDGEIDFLSLEDIDGELKIDSKGKDVSLLFNNLKQMNSDNNIKYNFTLSNNFNLANFTSLESVNGELKIDSKGKEASLLFENLKNVEGHISLLNNIKIMNFSSLDTVAGNLKIDSKEKGTSLSFDSLTQTEGELSITASIASMNFSSVKKINGNLYFNFLNSSELETISFNSLKSIKGKLMLRTAVKNNSVTAIVFPELSEDVTSLEIGQFAELTEISMPNLPKIGKGNFTFRLSDYPKLEKCDLGANNTCTIK